MPRPKLPRSARRVHRTISLPPSVNKSLAKLARKHKTTASQLIEAWIIEHERGAPLAPIADWPDVYED